MRVYRLIVGMWPYLIFEAMRRYLQGQRVVWPMVVAATIVSPINVMLNYVLVYSANMGYLGAALATAITNWLVPTTICFVFAVMFISLYLTIRNLLITLVILINLRLCYRRRQRRLRAERRQYSQVPKHDLTFDIIAHSFINMNVYLC
jgi:O-antigen/teichoic acid export membrane protein